MKSLFKHMWIVVALLSGISFVACKKGSDGGVPAPVICPAGTVSPDGINCAPIVPGGAPGTRIGFFTQTSNFPNFNPAGSVMTLGAGFRSILKNAMGVCDRDSINGGLAACDAWLQGYHDMVIVMDGSNANQTKLVMRSYPLVNPNFNYTYSMPSFSEFFTGLIGVFVGNRAGVFDPLVLTTTIWPINNSQGFELRANGPTDSKAWWKLIQLQVTAGKIEDPSINFNLYIDGGNQQMAPAVSGTMVRCTTQSCGLPGL